MSIMVPSQTNKLASPSLKNDPSQNIDKIRHGFLNGYHYGRCINHEFSCIVFFHPAHFGFNES